ncbi:MAG: hypothetical protein ACOYXR_05680, partial [Nitrospirota bacterium]
MSKPPGTARASSLVQCAIFKIRAAAPALSNPVKEVIAVPHRPRIALIDPEAGFYRSALAELQKAYASSRKDGPLISHEYIQEKLNEAITTAIGEDGQGHPEPTRAFLDRMTAAIAAMEASLATAPTSWRVYVPLHAPVVDRVKRFGRVFFLPRASRRARRLQNLDHVGDAFDTEMTAMTVVSAVDGAAARALGGHEIRRTIDVLDYFGPTIEAAYLDPMTAFEAVEGGAVSGIVAVRHGRADLGRIQAGAAIRRLDEMGIGSHSKAYVAMNRLLRAASKESFESRLVNAAAWAGRANVQRRRDQVFLMRMIALESALSKTDEKAAPTERIRLRTAHVLGGDLAKRRESYRKAGELYKIRSDIVHAGQSPDLNEDSLGMMKSLL